MEFLIVGLLSYLVLASGLEFTNCNKPVSLLPWKPPANESVFKFGVSTRQDVIFSLLSPTNFSISPTSGILYATPSFYDEKFDFTEGPVIKPIKVYALLEHSSTAEQAVCSMSIYVTETINNAPYFLLSSYNFTVTPSSNSTFFVGNVSARDIDGDTLTYTISTSFPPYDNLFDINDKTGEIYYFGNETRTNTTYELELLVADSGFPTLYASIVVHVNVNSMSPPIFKLHAHTANRYENEKPGEVMRFEVESLEPVQFALKYERFENESSSDTFRLEQMYPRSAVLYQDGQLDFKNRQRYELIIVAQNIHSNAKSNVTVYVNVISANDIRPKFTEILGWVHLFENVPIGTYVATAKATYPSNNTQLYYSLPSSQAFSIDAMTGDIFTAIDFDRETIEEYEVQISAFVRTAKGKSESHSRLLVHILDINDCPPKLNSTVITIRENFKIGKLVATIKINDDDDETPHFNFTVLSSPPTHDDFHFEVSLKNLNVYSQKRLDSQKCDYYNYTVLVSDGKFTTASSLQIYVNKTEDMYEEGTVEDAFMNSIICVCNRFPCADIPIPEHIMLFQLEFSVITDITNATILYMQGVQSTDFTQLYLEKGRLSLTSMYNNVRTNISLEEFISNNNWHDVDLSYSSRLLTLCVSNRTDNNSKSCQSETRIPIQSVLHVRIGGDEQQNSNYQNVSCLSQLTLNGVVLKVGAANVKTGCTATDFEYFDYVYALFLFGCVLLLCIICMLDARYLRYFYFIGL